LKALRSPPWLGWPLWNICVTNDHGSVPLVVNTSRSFPHSWLITGFITRVIRRVSLIEQELLSLPEHVCSTSVFSGVHVARSLVFWVVLCRYCSSFVDSCLSFFLCCLFFDLQILITPPLWYLQTLPSLSSSNLTFVNYCFDMQILCRIHNIICIFNKC
jgi:hypothetical protein